MGFCVVYVPVCHCWGALTWKHFFFFCWCVFCVFGLCCVFFLLVKLNYVVLFITFLIVGHWFETIKVPYKQIKHFASTTKKGILFHINQSGIALKYLYLFKTAWYSRLVCFSPPHTYTHSVKQYLLNHKESKGYFISWGFAITSHMTPQRLYVRPPPWRMLALS